MTPVPPLGWTEALAAEEVEVRARWNRLRAALPLVARRRKRRK